MFDGLPVLVIDHPQDLTEDLLRKSYNEFAAARWDLSSIYLGHYHSKLGAYRPGYNKRYKIMYATKSSNNPPH
jgi:hypothetical protein